jgi:hypothetical protein
MTDVETLVRDCLARHAEDAPKALDLVRGAYARSRQLHRRRYTVAAMAAVPALAAGAVGALSIAADRSPSNTRISVAPSAEETATSTPGPVTGIFADVIDKCPDDQRPNFTIDQAHPVATGTQGNPSDALARQHGGLQAIFAEASTGFFVNGKAAAADEMWLAVFDGRSRSAAASYVTAQHTDGSWAAWTATFAGCRPSS